jgi:hypothetical protein
MEKFPIKNIRIETGIAPLCPGIASEETHCFAPAT